MFIFYILAAVATEQSGNSPFIEMRDGSFFSLESDSFSKLANIKTWVADEYQKDSNLMQAIQYNVGCCVKSNPYSETFVQNIPQDNDAIFFGQSYQIMSSIALPYLQHIKKSKPKNILEIGVGLGVMTSYAALALDPKSATLYANDISNKVLEGLFTHIINDSLRYFPKAKKCIKKLPMSCLDIPTKCPELKGKMNAIFMQNVGHFFSPKKHQELLKVIDQLLAPEGKAFICDLSFRFNSNSTHPAFAIYEQRKNSKDELTATYSGYIEQIRGNFVLGYKNPLSNDENFDYPKDFKTGYIEQIRGNFVLGYKNPLSNDENFDYPKDFKNCFSPGIYKRSIELYNKESNANLRVKDAFFVFGRTYAKAGTWQKCGDQISNAACIVKKPS